MTLACILNVMSLPLYGKVSLITGASRGIGATAAVKLALLGSDVAINYRSKSARAEQVCQRVESLGRKAIAVQADLTIRSEVDAMMPTIQKVYKRLDILILNASGGLEQGKADGYAMTLNHTAQLQTASAAIDLMLERRTNHLCDEPLGSLLWSTAGNLRLRSSGEK